MLRSHEVLQGPLHVDLGKSIDIEVPDAWKDEIKEPQVRVLPLVSNPDQRYPDGWCTYTYEHVQAPELELICGGVNAKTPKASAVWRQGNLLHFGFEQHPGELNENGQAILANSITYIARFTEDRPIVRTPSSFYSSVRLLDRGVIDRLVKNESRDLEQYLNFYLSEEERELMRGKKRSELAAWFESVRGFVHADKRGRFKIDPDAEAFGVAIDSSDFIPALIDAMDGTEERRGLARRLRERYVAIGPDETSSIAWQQWWTAHKDYLFSSDTGGFQWQLDSLAQKRNVPSKDLRGAARASREPIAVGRGDAN